MGCIKCGTNTEESHVFCSACLEKMSRYPLKPDIALLLPIRNRGSVHKAVKRRRAPSPEERIAQLRKAIRVLSVCLASLLLIFSLTVAILLQTLRTGQPDSPPNIGQNFSTAGKLTTP